MSPTDKGDVWLDGPPPPGWREVRPPQRWVYFFRCEQTGLIKIGSTSDVARRLQQIHEISSTKYEFLLAFWGDFKEERALHRQFADLRMHSEWFRPEPRLLEFLENVKRQLQDPSFHKSAVILPGEIVAVPRVSFEWRKRT